MQKFKSVLKKRQLFNTKDKPIYSFLFSVYIQKSIVGGMHVGEVIWGVLPLRFPASTVKSLILEP